MALNIKNPEADELARQLAERTGRSITEVVVSALRVNLLPARGRGAARGSSAHLWATRIARDRQTAGAALPDLDRRSAEEILGFDEVGVPR